MSALCPTYVKELGLDPDKTAVLMCGPPIMIKFTLAGLMELGLRQNAGIYHAWSCSMKCGIGKCGRCNIGRQIRLQGRPGVPLR